jgi:hypothetical protein
VFPIIDDVLGAVARCRVRDIEVMNNR